jgi:hypothetical protein
MALALAGCTGVSLRAGSVLQHAPQLSSVLTRSIMWQDPQAETMLDGANVTQRQLALSLLQLATLHGRLAMCRVSAYRTPYEGTTLRRHKVRVAPVLLPCDAARRADHVLDRAHHHAPEAAAAGSGADVPPR